MNESGESFRPRLRDDPDPYQWQSVGRRGGLTQGEHEVYDLVEPSIQQAFDWALQQGQEGREWQQDTIQEIYDYSRQQGLRRGTIIDIYERALYEEQEEQ